MNRPICIICSTFEKHEDAEKAGQMLLEKRMIACAQISSTIASLYRWQGKLERAEEVMLTMKTLPHKLSAVQEALEKNHPYDTPEVLVQSTCEVSEKYYRWMLEEVQ